jgi:peroxiredoxin Q/BCP
MGAEIGGKAPLLTLKAADGCLVSLKSWVGTQLIVLYFYPKDMTPGCTTEACDFRDNLNRLKKLDAIVLGVSPDSVDHHRKFTDKQELNFPLLADENHKICEKYGTWVEKNMYGRKYWGVERATFLIDLDGRILRAWRKVCVKNHVNEIIQAIQDMKP